jgi:hypothetical protein
MSRKPNDQQIQNIASAYQAGNTIRDLAKRHALSSSTILKVLKESGVPRRPAGRRVLHVKERRCTLCGELKPIERFTKNSLRAIGYDYTCRACDRKKAKQKNIVRNFGITLQMFRKLEAEQGGGCAICGRKETRRRRGKAVRLSVDHDHKTGQIRGLLCTTCNTALGLMNDDTKRLRRAAEYLDKHAYRTVTDGG